MKKTIIYVVCALLLIIDVIITATLGLNVSLYYGEGYTISFTEENNIDINEVKQIANEILGKDVVVRKMEFFNDSAKIKVTDTTDEQIQQLCDKINEKYSSEKEISDFKVEHVSNVKIRTIVEPYIAPVGISLLLVLTYFAIRYRGTRQMIELIKYVACIIVLLYSVHSIARIPINVLTMPCFLTLYGLVLILLTTYFENKKESNE